MNWVSHSILTLVSAVVAWLLVGALLSHFDLSDDIQNVVRAVVFFFVIGAGFAWRKVREQRESQ